MHIPPALTQNTDVALTSAAGFGTTLSLASTTPVDPANPWTFLSYIPALIGPALAVLMNRWLSAQAARKQARATFLTQEAKQLEQDSDKTNDGKARELRLEAAELQAEADALTHKQR
jgi:hypothetical protein